MVLRLASWIDSLDGLQPIVAFFRFAPLRIVGKKTLSALPLTCLKEMKWQLQDFLLCSPNGICLRSVHHEFLTFFFGFVISDLLIRTISWRVKKIFENAE